MYQLMVADEVKYFSLEHAQKKTMFSIFDTRVYFWPYKRYAFLPCICFPQRHTQCHLWSCALSAKWRLKLFIYASTITFQYLKKRFAIQYSTLSLTGGQFISLKFNESIWDLGAKFRQKWIHLFWAFEFWFLNFSLKEETMRNIHNWIVAQWARCIIVFHTQELITCFVDIRVLV